MPSFLGDHVAYVFAVVLVALVGIVVLSALHDKVPDVLSAVVIGLTVGGAALATPNGRGK